MNSDYSISVRSITKVFAGVKALDNVSIDVVSGKVHGLIGANGAGKSTLIKILAGVYHPDEGQILIDGNEVKITDPATSTALGLSFIHQDLHLVEHFNVMQNMLMGEKKDTKLGLIDWKKSTQKIQKVLELVNFTKPLTTKAKDLSTGDQWLIAIAKALMHDAKFIAMDEPTAALSEAEVENLFRIVRDLTSHGIGVIYVSHRLDEILELCDEITVFKDGKKILYELTSNISKEELITAIAGHKIKHLDSITYRFSDAETVLQVEHLHDKMDRVKDVSFELKKGEVLGITGLVGAGRTETALSVYGANPLKNGKMTLYGKDYTPKSPHDAVNSKIVLVPENRRLEGLITNQTVNFNTNIPTLSVLRVIKNLPFISPRKSKAVTQEAIKRLQIKVNSPQDPVLSLSGGNQQKVVIGKWLQRQPQIIIMDEPTQGVDVGARTEIYKLIRSMAEKEGISFLIISSDIEELPGLCDRVIVMAEGTVTGELINDEINSQSMLRLSYAAQYGDTEHEYFR